MANDNEQKSDPLHQALVEATFAVLLGSLSITQQTVDPNGVVSLGYVTIPSVFAQRIQSKAYNGEYDSIIAEAMEHVSPSNIATAIEGMIAEQIIEGLGSTRRAFGNDFDKNWLETRARDIAVMACTAAMASDEELLDTLRAKISSEVDRNHVGITVNLSDPEKA